eukprot:UN30557
MAVMSIHLCKNGRNILCGGGPSLSGESAPYCHMADIVHDSFRVTFHCDAPLLTVQQDNNFIIMGGGDEKLKKPGFLKFVDTGTHIKQTQFKGSAKVTCVNKYGNLVFFGDHDIVDHIHMTNIKDEVKLLATLKQNCNV